MRWVVLLKGLNTGGKRLASAELKAFLEGLGFTGVSTLLASGNAVFEADETDGAALEARIEAAASEGLAISTDWLVRNRVEIDAIIAGNPFPRAAAEHPNHLLVHFHREPVPAEAMHSLEHDGPERMASNGRELYVDYPDDIGHSKLPQAMAKAKFPALATARNWNTVLKIAELLAAEAKPTVH